MFEHRRTTRPSRTARGHRIVKRPFCTIQFACETQVLVRTGLPLLSTLGSA